MKQSLQEILSVKGDGLLCTSAVILDKDKRILLGLRHYKNKWKGELAGDSLWTTPGGRTDTGETLGDCLVRETKEETGLDIAPAEYWGEIPAARSVDILHVFFCEYRGESQNREPEKFGSWSWFALGDIPENFINPHLLRLLNDKLG